MNTQRIHIHLGEELLAMVDRHLDHLEKKTGLRPSRAALIRAAMKEYLNVKREH